ncbi:hypothetical protein ACFWB5_09230 [Corynebacterium xerosis]|uniref:hypothetical protein n=1 Tax=Corynebacterium xerosis TaxID=1725 RepID=UPI00364E8189
MARFGNDQTNIGRLDIRATAEGGRVDAFFVPTELPHEESSARRRLAEGVKLVEFDSETGLLKIHPINTLATHSEDLGPKYAQVLTLTLQTSSLEEYYEGADLESIFETLPHGFVKDFAYGLGLLKDCNRLIRLIEANTPCTEIIFTNGNSATINRSGFHLSLSRFAAIWADRSNQRPGQPSCGPCEGRLRSQ